MCRQVKPQGPQRQPEWFSMSLYRLNTAVLVCACRKTIFWSTCAGKYPIQVNSKDGQRVGIIWGLSGGGVISGGWIFLFSSPDLQRSVPCSVPRCMWMGSWWPILGKEAVSENWRWSTGPPEPPQSKPRPIWNCGASTETATDASSWYGL